MVEEQVYCRYKGVRSQEQRHLRESTVDMALNLVECEEGKGEGEREEPGAAGWRPKVQKRVGNQNG